MRKGHKRAHKPRWHVRKVHKRAHKPRWDVRNGHKHVPESPKHV